MHRNVAPSSGEVLPSDLPQMREAMAAGHVGVDAVVAVAKPLLSALPADRMSRRR